MSKFNSYQKLFLDYLESNLPDNSPKSLYDPTKYILTLGGKRIRPIFTLMSVDIFNGNIKDALPAALAIEIFHNFSLVHDDIMDNAPLRRGKETVHKKWNLNTAILSGDVMLIWSYEILQQYSSEISVSLTKLFSQTARKVCEGQQLDIDFPIKSKVSIEDYMKMIEYKTAVLIGCSLSVGAIISNASLNQIAEINSIGIDIGLIFQLQDDYLDVFGSISKIGKQIGGDIIENKKTFLHVYVLENGSENELKDFDYWLKLNPKDPRNKILGITDIYNSSGATKAIKNKIKILIKSVYHKIENMKLEKSKKKLIFSFFEKIKNRDF
tara:strand:- start:1217 stop:2191 length:975 start_codon:yes stop_codon:yes gene_type:complete